MMRHDLQQSGKNVSSRNKQPGGSEKLFPGKLHDLLSYVQNHSLESVVSWTPAGDAFMVHNPEKLLDVLPIFFGQTQIRSFHRQLNMWHFERIADGPDKGAFRHPYFIRGKRSMVARMSRNCPPSPESKQQILPYQDPTKLVQQLSSSVEDQKIRLSPTNRAATLPESQQGNRPLSPSVFQLLQQQNEIWSEGVLQRGSNDEEGKKEKALGSKNLLDSVTLSDEILTGISCEPASPETVQDVFDALSKT